MRVVCVPTCPLCPVLDTMVYPGEKPFGEEEAARLCSEAFLFAE